MKTQDDVINIQISKKALADSMGFLTGLAEQCMKAKIIDQDFVDEINARTVSQLKVALENSRVNL